MKDFGGFIIALACLPVMLWSVRSLWRLRWKDSCRQSLLRFLGLHEIDGRLKTVETHFVTKRDEQGNIVETLAEVPLAKRAELRKGKTAGMSWPQRRAYLEATDGERRAPIAVRMEGNS